MHGTNNLSTDVTSPEKKNFTLEFQKLTKILQNGYKVIFFAYQN